VPDSELTPALAAPSASAAPPVPEVQQSVSVPLPSVTAVLLSVAPLLLDLANPEPFVPTALLEEPDLLSTSPE
jgi:hypothetical protein